MLPLELIENIKLLAPLPQCIMVWDRSLCCKSVSKNTAYNLFALESGFIEHQFFSDLPIRAETRLRIRKAFDTARASGRKTELLQSVFINNQRTDVETAFIPQFENGSFVGVITVCHSSNVLRELKHRTETLVRATAHDLRTPVNNIQNLCKLLTVASSDETRSSIVQRMNESVSILSELLESMMELAETRTDEPPQPEIINVNQAIDEVVNVFNDELSSIGAEVVRSIQVDSIEFSKGYFRSILFNLISNAVKYRSNDRKLRISIQTRPAQNGLWLEVTDNGIGIDLMGTGNDLFKPFTRLTTQAEGRGVGLSLVKSFVESTGGEITVVSEPGVGTSFRILLLSRTAPLHQYVLFE